VTAQPIKFLFDRDFDAPEAVEPEIPVLPVATHEQELRAAEQRAYERGLAEGRAAEKKEAENLFATNTKQMAAAITAQFEAMDDEIARHAGDAAALALEMAHNLAPKLIALEPVAEIEALVDECVRHLRTAPHLVVRVNESLHEIANARVSEIAALAGYEGRVIVMGEPDIALGDCRIEWAEGGIERDTAARTAAITERVNAYITARQQRLTD